VLKKDNHYGNQNILSLCAGVLDMDMFMRCAYAYKASFWRGICFLILSLCAGVLDMHMFMRCAYAYKASFWRGICFLNLSCYVCAGMQ
jgi:hypothetical protein